MVQKRMFGTLGGRIETFGGDSAPSSLPDVYSSVALGEHGVLRQNPRFFMCKNSGKR